MRSKCKNFFSNGQDQFLFDRDEFVKRPSPDYREFVELLTPYVSKIETAVSDAQNLLREFHSAFPKHYSDAKLDAHLFNHYVKGKLKDSLGHELFGETPEGRVYLKLGRYVLFIKKVNESYEPSNVQTVNTKRINAQYASATEEPKSIIYIGYKGFRGDLCDIEGVFAIHIDTEQDNKWILPLSFLREMRTNIFAEKAECLSQQIDSTRVRVKKVLQEAL